MNKYLFLTLFLALSFSIQAKNNPKQQIKKSICELVNAQKHISEYNFQEYYNVVGNKKLENSRKL